MNKKQIAALPLEIDTPRYQKMVDDALEKTMRDTINNRISFLFINPAEQSRYDYLKRAYPTDPDLAAGYNFVKEIIDKKLLEEKFQKYVDDYTDRNFARILGTALEKALEHKANAMAFKIIKNRLTIDGCDKVSSNGELRQYVDDNVKKI